MKNKGFTLVELLAVIVVLGVIALISIPITTNLIEQSRQNSFRNSVSGMMKSIEIYYTKKAGSEIFLNLTPGADKTLNYDAYLSDLDFTGSKPTAGYAYVAKDGTMGIIMYNVYYCGYKKLKEESVTVLDLDDCPPSNEMTVQTKLETFLGIK